MLALKRKALVMVAAAGMTSAVFQPAGCTLNVDQGLVQTAMNWWENNQDNFTFGADGSVTYTPDQQQNDEGGDDSSL